MKHRIELELAENGTVQACNLMGKEICFRRDEYAGFCPFLVLKGKKRPVKMRRLFEKTFCGRFGALEFVLEYVCGEELIVRMRVRNTGEVSFKPTTLGLCTGIDCHMEKYPDWNRIFFPTLLRCEKGHFWGYNERPDGTVLAFVSEEATASWSIAYNEMDGTEDDAMYLNGGHRIYTWNIHLLNRLPKPDRHPLQDELLPGEEKTLTLHFGIAAGIREVPDLVARMGRVPVIQLSRYTLEKGQSCRGMIRNAETLCVYDPAGDREEIRPEGDGSFTVAGNDREGLYRICARQGNQKEAEALYYVEHRHSWYLHQAREAVLHNRPLHTHHVESFNSLYTILLAGRYLPDRERDASLEEDFLRITKKLYDDKKQMAAQNPWRIQDSAALCSLFAFRYENTGDPEDLRKAGHLADFLLSSQGEDGAYYSIRPDGQKTHYTAVTYIAKYILDAARIEEKAGQRDTAFAEAAKRHKESVQKAVAELVRNRDNIDTEGELTFEDGMISCSLLQIAYFAFEMPEGDKREQYIEAARQMYDMHECLTQKLVPDCRMNGGTLRFWEAQYNLHIFHNMMNSPCGWTAWKIYGTWYLYLLTGKKEYLLDTINAMGACLQLVDAKTGALRWGFICDPYVETLRYVQEEPGSCRGKLVDDILCEQYVDMVSPWHRQEAFPRKKWAIDNLVHEIFKCLTEVGLLNACVYEEEDGSLFTWNCRAGREGETVTIDPAERIIERVHVNFRKERPVVTEGTQKRGTYRCGWVLVKERKEGTVYEA